LKNPTVIEYIRNFSKRVCNRETDTNGQLNTKIKELVLFHFMETFGQ